MVNDWETCIHRQSGLCPDCQADFDADPMAWIEFGNHPQGLARWQDLQEEMKQTPPATLPVDDSTIPF